MDAPREIELKLQCEGADLTELARHPFLHSAEPEQAAFLTSTYYDTAAGDLREAGLSLRVRREGEAYLQTVKVASAGAGLFDRPEWEGPVADAQPDLARSARLSQDEVAMTRKHQPNGRGSPRPNCAPTTAALWPVIASQRSRTKVSSRRWRASRTKPLVLMSIMSRKR
jgi:hypothetical protein